MDLLIENGELKTVECFTDVHVAQVLSYLKATSNPLALLINFNVLVLLRGVKRLVRNRSSTPVEGSTTTADPGAISSETISLFPLAPLAPLAVSLFSAPAAEQGGWC